MVNNGEQQIFYEGPKFGARFYGGYVKDKHIQLAKDWFTKQMLPKKYEHHNQNVHRPVIEFSTTCFHIIKQINWKPENISEIANSVFSASDYRDNNSPPPPWTPGRSSLTINISKWLASQAYVRAGFMHEIIETYIMIGYEQFASPERTNQHQIDAHNETCKIVEKFTFEDPNSEKQIRIDNRNQCEEDLDKIIKWMSVPSLISTAAAAFNLVVLRGIRGIIQNKQYIPGYCEAYVPLGYEDKELSSIAYIFENAKKLGIIKR